MLSLGDQVLKMLHTESILKHGIRGLCLVGALFASTLANLTQAIAGATPPHLYVAVQQLGYGPGPGYILRYALRGSSIARKPDLKYDGYAGPIAFGPDGTLFAGLGSLQQATRRMYAFQPGATRPSASYGIPAVHNGSAWITAAAVDGRGYLSMAYTITSGSSQPFDVGLVTYRTSDNVRVNNTIWPYHASFPFSMYGIGFDVERHLYVTPSYQVQVYASVENSTLRGIGSIHGSATKTPGSVGLNQGELLVVNLPAQGKISIATYPKDARGNVPAIRRLAPKGPDNAITPCCGSFGPTVLNYQIDVRGSRLYVPFFALEKSGASVTGVYVFDKTQSGRSEPESTTIIASTKPSQLPVVVTGAIVGP
jgi:hypothetical protein